MTTLRELVTLLGFKVDDAGVKKGDAAFNALIKKAETLKTSLDVVARRSAIAFAGISAGLGLAVKAASDEEAELRRLQTAVEGTGRSWANSKLELLAFAMAQEKVTNYSHDEYHTALRTIIAITGKYEKGIAGAGLAANVAAKYHVDLEAAARAVAFAYEGQLRKVNMILPVLGKLEQADIDLKTASDKAAFAIALLTSETRGAAAKDMGTYASSIKHVAFETDKLREAVGQPFLTNLKTLNINLSDYLGKLTKYVEEHPKLTAVLGATAWAGTGLTSVVSKVAAGLLGLAIYAKIANTTLWALLGTQTMLIGGMAAWVVTIGSVVLAVQDLWSALAGGESVFGRLERASRGFWMGLAQRFAPKLAAKVLAEEPDYLEGRYAKPSAPLAPEFQGPPTKKSWLQLLSESFSATPEPAFAGAAATPTAMPKTGGGAKEIYRSLVSGWNESMFATRPVGGRGGITNAPTIIQHIDARGADPDTTKRVVYEAADEVVQKYLGHANHNLLTPE